MALTQKYGIKYPFTCDNTEEVFLDLNKTYSDSIKSMVLHVLFTPKGQRLRDPEFGTDLIKFIYEPSDTMTYDSIKSELSSQILKYVPNVEFRDINIYTDENNSNSIVVMVEYGIKRGNKTEVSTVAVKL